MSFDVRVLVSWTFQREFKKTPLNSQTRIQKSLTCREEDPYAPRAHADIKPLKDTHPQKYRLRAGNFRIVYVVEGNEGKILDMLHRRREDPGQ